MKHSYKIEFKNPTGRTWKLICWYHGEDKIKTFQLAIMMMDKNKNMIPCRAYRIVDASTNEVVREIK